jgi:hypothetical protein
MPLGSWLLLLLQVLSLRFPQQAIVLLGQKQFQMELSDY